MISGLSLPLLNMLVILQYFASIQASHRHNDGILCQTPISPTPWDVITRSLSEPRNAGPRAQHVVQLGLHFQFRAGKRPSNIDQALIIVACCPLIQLVSSLLRTTHTAPEPEENVTILTRDNTWHWAWQRHDQLGHCSLVCNMHINTFVWIKRVNNRNLGKTSTHVFAQFVWAY